MNRARQATSYDDQFYGDQSPGSERSAQTILPLTFELFRPTSVVDVGCGIGTWLRVAQQLGVGSVVGIDGEYARRAGLLIDETDFRAVDLASPLGVIERRFDMAFCLEVAEHLSETRAEGLIRDVCSLSDVVLFSAAIPCQGGTSHINLQPQSAWAARFESHGYSAFDVIRPLIWHDDSVEPWYRQNLLLYVHQRREDLIGLAEHRQRTGPVLLDVVHPDLVQFWERRATRPVSVGQGAKLTIAAARSALKRRMGQT